MLQAPASSSSGWDADPAGELPTPDWMSAADWQAWCDVSAAEAEEPGSFEDEFWDPEEGDAEAVTAETDALAAQQAEVAAHIAAMGETAAMGIAESGFAGRRGPGQPGSSYVLSGVFSGPGGGFATGHGLDTAAGGGVLLSMTQRLAEDPAHLAALSDDELLGALAATDRCEASAAATKHVFTRELIRRRPSRKGGRWAEFTERELGAVLADSPHAMEDLLEQSDDLAAKLPGTATLFGSGVITQYKAHIIATACRLLDEAEAQAAEAMVLDRAGRLTPSALRAAIARAVMEVNAKKAKKRREASRKLARVHLWPEPSGNAAIEARELPATEGEAIDQRISWWARQLKKAGLEGSFDELRALAFGDLMLARDSRPGHEDDGPSRGFTGRVNLTMPLSTALGLADRPGEFGALGPIDPWLARDLAATAAQSSRSTWCVTVTDQDGHAVGHGCARPGPARRGQQTQQPSASQRRQRPPPGGTGVGFAGEGGTGFSFTREGGPGPPGGYGTWRLRIPGDGPDFLVTLDPITTDPCDHRFEGSGHDPGTRLRHLTGVRYARCTAPGCRRPAAQCDFEHNTPHEEGGKTCLCNGSPKCRRDHRMKQDPGWNAEQRPDGTFRWTTPAGRSYDTEPTRYPI